MLYYTVLCYTILYYNIPSYSNLQYTTLRNTAVLLQEIQQAILQTPDNLCSPTGSYRKSYRKSYGHSYKLLQVVLQAVLQLPEGAADLEQLPARKLHLKARRAFKD